MNVAARVALGALGIVVAGAGGCGKRPREKQEAPRDARPRRVIEPSSERVGPLPPYAIRADGIGPYKIGERMSDLLEHLAHGPRIALFEIPGVVHRDVIHAEEDTILVGGAQASTASFVAVVGGEVARTESGIHVGSTRDELASALGPPIDDPERGHDPRLLMPSTMPSLRAVIEDDRIVAIVVSAAPAPAVPRPTTECQRPAPREGVFGACMAGTGELLQVTGDEVVIRSVEGERVLATTPRLPGLAFAVPLRGADGKDELAVITRADEPAKRSWSISAYRFEGARLVRSVDAAQVYQLSTANARWIGADLRDVELYLELASRADGIEVSGLLATLNGSREATKIRDLVVVATVSVPRRRGKSATQDTSDTTPAGSSQVNRVPGDAAIDALEPPSGAADPDAP